MWLNGTAHPEMSHILNSNKSNRWPAVLHNKHLFYPTLPCFPVINKPALHDQHQQTPDWALNYCWLKTSWASKQDPLLIDPYVKKKHKKRKTSKNTDTWKTNHALLMDILQPIKERFLRLPAWLSLSIIWSSHSNTAWGFLLRYGIIKKKKLWHLQSQPEVPIKHYVQNNQL